MNRRKLPSLCMVPLPILIRDTELIKLFWEEPWGFSPDDVRIRDAFEIAKKKGLNFTYIINGDEEIPHPNTADILLDNGKGYTLLIRGVSVGGGKIKLTKFNDIDVEFTGEYSALIVKQHDVPGVAAHITKCLYEANVNIAFMNIFREDKGTTAYTVIESDEKIPAEVISSIENDEKILNVKLVQI